MTKSQSFSLSFAFVVFFLHPLLLQSSCVAESAPKTARIGVIAPLTGPLANIGASLQEMVQVADSVYDRKNLVDFVIEDDQFKAAQTVSAFQKLRREGLDGLISFGSGTSLALAPLIERARIPTIAIAMSPKPVEKSAYMFRLYPSLERQTKLLVEFVRRKNFQRVAVLTTEQEALLSFRDSFLSENESSFKKQFSLAKQHSKPLLVEQSLQSLMLFTSSFSHRN